jgi:Zinc finger found in FPG and IleRS
VGQGAAAGDKPHGIRQEKQKDWEACRWWAERGLALYGNNAARGDAVEDLLNRRNRALAKLEAPHRASHPAPVTTIDTAVADRTDVPPATTFAANGEIEVLVCSRCRGSFERVRVRGRKPLLCPACRSSTNDPQGGS